MLNSFDLALLVHTNPLSSETAPAVDYLERMRMRVEGAERGVPRWLGDKRLAKHFAASVGLKVPRTLLTFEDLDALDLSNAPDRFVLKPTFLSSTYGVMVLERRGESTFYDALRGRELTVGDILEEERSRLAAALEDGVRRSWIVEEIVEDSTGASVPDDWKFFAFQGRIGLIHRTVRARPRNIHSYFHGDFRPMPLQSGLYSVNEALVDARVSSPPLSWHRMLRDVRRLSIAAPVPFVRIDMYDSSVGPMFGEFTLTPGTFYYEDRETMSPALSAELGLLWDGASCGME